MSETIRDNSGTNFETPATKEEQIPTSVFSEPRRSVKRLITSPVLLHYSQPSKKSKPKSESSVSSTSEESDMANLSVIDEPMGETSQLISVPMQPDDISRVAFELKPIMLPEMRLPKHLKSPKNQNRRAALGRPAIKITGGLQLVKDD